MVERLHKMQAAMPEFEASAVVSVDSLIIPSMAKALHQNAEEGRVSAMLSPGECSSSEFSRDGLEQVNMKGGNSAIVLTAMGDGAGSTAMSSQEIKLA